jgi:Tfp pilus assembly protein FimT
VEENVKNSHGITLLELLVVIGLIAFLSGMAGAPFLAWYRRSILEVSAGTLHETFKWAQSQAMKRGGVEMINYSSHLIKKRIYVALDQAAGNYQVIQWRDDNHDGVRDANEFTVLNSGSLGKGRVHFGLLPSVNKAACSDGTSDSDLVIRNFMSCPPVELLNGQKCMRFDDKGFLSESLQNAGLFITNDEDSFAISLNPAGIITLCRWNGTGWLFVR